MKAHFYEVQRIKEGWVPKYRNNQYNYIRMPKSPTFSTIEEAEEYIRENFIPQREMDQPWIDHKLDKWASGHLMSLESWKENCDFGGFIDYDGYGNAVDENYNIIEMSDSLDFEGNNIRPSDYTDRGGKNIPANTKYILWYNR
jgi:hypothetical protein